MTKKLEELLNLPEQESLVDPTPTKEIPPAVINLQERLEEFDKISSALPKVEGLGQMSDTELDIPSTKDIFLTRSNLLY